MITKNSKIYISGHNGMVGSSILRNLKEKGYKNLITINKKNLDLRDQKKTYTFLKRQKPDVVIIAAAKVGGINANNKYRADFLLDNLQIQNNLIKGSYDVGVKKLIFLGSSCIYPKYAQQPIKEDYLLTSSLEYTNEPYAIAKIAGLKLCENYNIQYNTDFLSLMPCNLYGPGDNYNLETSHFIPALINKIHAAKQKKLKEITIWGDGRPLREVMHVDDLANACIFFLKKKTKFSLINIGSNEEYSINQYAEIIMNHINYNCKIRYEKSMPNGTPRKILDINRAKKLGWRSKINFVNGLESAYKDYISKLD